MWAKNVRYLDYNASSGITVSVRNKLAELLARSELYFANPSSNHRLGQQSQQLLMRSGMKIASSLGEKVDVNQLVFASSGTEANQTIIRSAMNYADAIIIGAGEHSASYDLLSKIPAPLKSIELPLSNSGHYDFDALKNILNELKVSGFSKVFLSLFWANNETGVLTNLQELGKIISNCGINVFLHLDGAQVWGKIPFDVFHTPAHYITFSSHKIGAPAGVGVIWIRPGSPFDALILGSQSAGRRGGTENILAITSLSIAVEELHPVKFSEHTLSLRTRLEEGLKNLPIKVWSSHVDRISNTSRFSFLGFKNYENWVELFDLRGFAVSHGSACKSKIVEPSRVLLKMGASENEALNAIRVSFGPTIQPIDVDEFLVAIRAILEEKDGRS